jgi:hypothetical protein
MANVRLIKYEAVPACAYQLCQVIKLPSTPESAEIRLWTVLPFAEFNTPRPRIISA